LVVHLGTDFLAVAAENRLVQRFLNPHMLSAWYFRQRKVEEGSNTVALLT